jgi:hypothetical protein
VEKARPDKLMLICGENGKHRIIEMIQFPSHYGNKKKMKKKKKNGKK